MLGAIPGISAQVLCKGAAAATAYNQRHWRALAVSINNMSIKL